MLGRSMYSWMLAALAASLLSLAGFNSPARAAGAAGGYLKSNADPGARINITLETDRREVEPGDPISLTAKTDRDCYLTIFYVEEDGGVMILWPNKSSGWDNWVRAGQRIRVGSPGGLVIEADGAQAYENIGAYATTDKEAIFSDQDFRSAAGGAVKHFEGGIKGFRSLFDKRTKDFDKRVAWGSTTTSIRVVPKFVARTTGWHQPWSAYWWPFNGEQGCGTIYGYDGPAAKYDQYVEATRGFNPGYADWERANHGPGSADWEGHCNGVCSSSILEQESQSGITKAGVHFTVADLKAILADAYYGDPTDAFIGQNYGLGYGDYSDPSPHLFHRALIDWIGVKKTRSSSSGRWESSDRRGKGKPLVMDKNAGEQVWNYPIYAYRMKLEKDGSDESKRYVTCTIQFADFADCGPNYVGTEKDKATYTYWIRGDVFKPTAGGWTGESVNDHPDFLWVPAYCQPSPGCPIDCNIVREILE